MTQAYRLEDMIGGWFVGAFEPTAHASSAAEVSIKRYAAGTREPAHVHRVAVEITAIVEGRARMADRTVSSGDIIVIEPGEASSFEALTDTVLVAVKLPSVVADKFLS